MEQLEGIEREIGEQVDLSIIWLHGLGADASDFLPIIADLKLVTGVRFVFPNAPMRRVTVNGGMMMRAWYDISGFGPSAAEDIAGLMDSVAIVRQLVSREIARGIAPERVLLAGFSQGGAVVLHAGLATDSPPGGVIGLSTYLPAASHFQSAATIAREVPVMLAHGTNDPVIPLALAEQSAAILSAGGIEVAWTTYPIGHEVSWSVINDISDWLRRFATL